MVDQHNEFPEEELWAEADERRERERLYAEIAAAREIEEAREQLERERDFLAERLIQPRHPLRPPPITGDINEALADLAEDIQVDIETEPLPALAGGLGLRDRTILRDRAAVEWAEDDLWRMRTTPVTVKRWICKKGHIVPGTGVSVTDHDNKTTHFCVTCWRDHLLASIPDGVQEEYDEVPYEVAYPTPEYSDEGVGLQEGPDAPIEATGNITLRATGNGGWTGDVPAGTIIRNANIQFDVNGGTILNG